MAGPIQIICEATGGYEKLLLGARHAAQVSVTLVNPRQVRDFARAKGWLAKTDALDAAGLAEYGRLFQPAPTVARTPAQQRLRALITRRQELLELITQEQHRAEHHHEASVIKKPGAWPPRCAAIWSSWRRKWPRWKKRTRGWPGGCKD